MMAILGVLHVLSGPAFGAERMEFYNGVRGLGMGGAQMATVNDETSALINPAGLGKLRDSFLTVVDPEVHVGSESQSIVGYDWFSASDPQAILEKMRDGGHFSKHFHQGQQLFPSFVVPNFGIGLLHTSFSNASFENAGADFRFRHRTDYGLILGYNFRLFDGRLKIGFNTRVMNRTEANALVPAASTNLTLGGMAKEGMGIGSDVGVLLAMPWQWLPTIGFVYRDVGNTRYDYRGGLFRSTTDRPDSTPATMDAAFGVSPIVSKQTRMTISAEYRDMQDAYDEKSFQRRFHAGVEWNFSDLFFFRAGMNQQYWTTGLELALFNYQLQFATYGEDVGTVSDPREDRRYVMKFAFRF